MDITFNCPHCNISLEVEADAAGQQFDCPSCHKPVSVPGAPPPAASKPPSVPVPVMSKEEKRFAVPVTEKPVESLIQKPSKSLEAAAKDAKPSIRVKTIRHSDCKEVGKDKFDEVVSEFLGKIGDDALVSITPINYSYIDLGTQKMLTDFGVMVVYRG